MTTDNLYFLDIETTGLFTELGHRPWEVAIVNIDGDVVAHHMWKPRPEILGNADPMALKISKFYQRINDPKTFAIRKDGESYAAKAVAETLAGATLCGAAVHFDAKMLDVWLREEGWVGTWSHRLLDIESYVAGATGHELPASLGDTASRVSVDYESDEKHTALYDAELARRCYAVLQGMDVDIKKSRKTTPEMPKPPKMGDES